MRKISEIKELKDVPKINKACSVLISRRGFNDKDVHERLYTKKLEIPKIQEKENGKTPSPKTKHKNTLYLKKKLDKDIEEVFYIVSNGKDEINSIEDLCNLLCKIAKILIKFGLARDNSKRDSELITKLWSMLGTTNVSLRLLKIVITAIIRIPFEGIKNYEFLQSPKFLDTFNPFYMNKMSARKPKIVTKSPYSYMPKLCETSLKMAKDHNLFDQKNLSRNELPIASAKTEKYNHNTNKKKCLVTKRSSDSKNRYLEFTLGLIYYMKDQKKVRKE